MIYIYLRVSTPGQSKKGLSLETQRKDAIDFATGEAKEPYRIYQDVKSGKDKSRVSWNRLKKDLESATEADMVWYSDSSRLMRNKIEDAVFQDLCERKNIKVYDAYDHTYRDYSQSGDRLIGTIKGAIDDEERRKIRDRTLKGLRAAWSKGGRVHTKVYGYAGREFDVESGKRIWKIVDGEAEIIRLIFDWYVNENLGFNGIAKRLNSKGYRKRGGDYWDNKSVKRLVSKSIYAGLTWTPEGKHVKSTRHEPIISQEIFKRASAKLKQFTDSAPKGRPPEHLGTALLRCSDCGAPYKIHKYKNYLYYVHHPENVDCKPGRKRFKYEIVNACLIEAYTTFLTEYPAAIFSKLKAEIQEEESKLSTDIDRIDSLILAKEKEIKNFDKAIASGVAIEHSIGQIAERQEEIKRLEKEKAELQSNLSMKTRTFKEMVSEHSYANLEAFFTTDDRMTRKMLLKKIIKRFLAVRGDLFVEAVDGRTMSFDYEEKAEDFKEDREYFVREDLAEVFGSEQFKMLKEDERADFIKTHYFSNMGAGYDQDSGAFEDSKDE